MSMITFLVGTCVGGVVGFLIAAVLYFDNTLK